MSSYKNRNPFSKHTCDNMFNVVVVGDSGVGKSSFLTRYSKSTYNQNFATTVGVDYAFCNIFLPDSTQVKFLVWDTAGQERFRAITMSYYRQAQGIFLMYDCCDMSSLESAKKMWLPSIRRYANTDAKIILVGNKADDIDEARHRGIDTEAIRANAKTFAEQQGIQHIETSAKNNNKVDEAFLSIAKQLKDQTVTRYQAGEMVHIDETQDRSQSMFAKLCTLLSNRSKRRRVRKRR